MRVQVSDDAEPSDSRPRLTEVAADTPAPDRRRPTGRGRRALLVVLVVLTVIALALAALYLNRRATAREVLTGWLDRRGINAEVEVERLEIDGFVGRIRIGDPTDPDVSVERVEVDYAVGLPWAAGGLGVTPSRIRLLRPIVKATWTGGELSFG